MVLQDGHLNCHIFDLQKCILIKMPIKIWECFSVLRLADHLMLRLPMYRCSNQQFVTQNSATLVSVAQVIKNQHKRPHLGTSKLKDSTYYTSIFTQPAFYINNVIATQNENIILHHYTTSTMQYYFITLTER